MQYYAVQLAVNALQAVLDGPEKLHETIHTAMPNARALAKDYPETHIYQPDDRSLPAARNGRALPLMGDPEAARPEKIKLAAFVLRQWPKHWRRSAAEADRLEPELEYSKRDAKWWIIPNHKSVIIGTADGSGKSWYRHDQKKFRKLWLESRRLTREIDKNWEQLRKRYRDALPEITSVEAWKRTFGVDDLGE